MYKISILAALTVLGVSSCNCRDPNLDSSSAFIEVEPLALDFGPVPVGLKASRTIEVRNRGRKALVLQPVSSVGDFEGPAQTVTIESGASQFIGVSFTPSVEGPRDAAMHLLSDAENQPDVLIQVTGIGIPRLICTDCLTPPANYCATDSTLVVYEPNGTCVGNQCQYKANTISCAAACVTDTNQCAPTDGGTGGGAGGGSGGGAGGGMGGGNNEPLDCAHAEITGDLIACPGATGLTYHVSAVQGATAYAWNFPPGWIITAGQGTRDVTVSAGQAGTVTVRINASCNVSAPISTKHVTGIRVMTGFYGDQANDFSDITIGFRPTPVTTTVVQACDVGCNCNASGPLVQLSTTAICLGEDVNQRDFTFSPKADSAAITIRGQGVHLYYPIFRWVYNDGSIGVDNIGTCDNGGYVYDSWDVAYNCTFTDPPGC